MPLTALYIILMKNEPYNPLLYVHINTPPNHRAVSVEEVVFFFQGQGNLVFLRACFCVHFFEMVLNYLVSTFCLDSRGM